MHKKECVLQRFGVRKNILSLQGMLHHPHQRMMKMTGKRWMKMMMKGSRKKNRHLIDAVMNGKL